MTYKAVNNRQALQNAQRPNFSKIYYLIALIMVLFCVNVGYETYTDLQADDLKEEN